MKTYPFLFVGPTTLELLNLINNYSSHKKKNIAYVATRNQIESEYFGTGYVNKLTTKKFSKIINSYNNPNLYLARDHCGPLINTKYDLKTEINNCIRVIDDDILNGFDYLHLDVSKLNNISKKIEVLQQIYDLSKIKNSKIKLEVGIDSHEKTSNFKEIKLLIKEFKVSHLAYVTISNGTYITENFQSGIYKTKIINKITNFLHEENILIKDHNSDYLEFNEIYRRLAGGVNSMNIQPQNAYIENSLILFLANKIGLTNEINNCYKLLLKNKNLKKWTTSKNKEKLFKLGLHYLQNYEVYKRIINKIKNKTNYTYLLKMLVYNNLDRYFLAYDSFYSMRRKR